MCPVGGYGRSRQATHLSLRDEEDRSRKSDEQDSQSSEGDSKMGIGTIATTKGRGLPLTVKEKRTKRDKPAARVICSCVPEPAVNAACSRCGHAGCLGSACPHCGQFYPLKSRPELVWWAEVQGKGGAVSEAGLTCRIIERLDMYGGQR